MQQTSSSSPDAIAHLFDESPITVAEAAKLLPTNRGKKRHLSSVVRWILHGKEGVRLEGFRAGETYFTTKQALARFFSMLTAKRRGDPLPLTPVQKKVDIEAGIQKMRKIAGFKTDKRRT